MTRLPISIVVATCRTGLIDTLVGWFIDCRMIQKPTAVVCAEGTEIYWFDHYVTGSHPKLDDEWREKLMGAWKYPQLKEVSCGPSMQHRKNRAEALVPSTPETMLSTVQKRCSAVLAGHPSVTKLS